MNFDLQNLVRPNILRLKPYSSARSEFAGVAEVFLDANENAFGSPAGGGLNRYPDPLQTELKARLAEINAVPPANIFVGNGSDEAIDLLFRIFCEPGRDEAIICLPTYGMYKVSADINDVRVKEVPLTDNFQLDLAAIKGSISDRSKILFICSPNNPTGNLMRRNDVIEIAGNYPGIVVVDEAYIHFANTESLTAEIRSLPNLVVLQTFSKAWAMAGLRVGLAFAGDAIIELMNRVKPPYNVSGIAQRVVIDALAKDGEVGKWIAETLNERKRLEEQLLNFDLVEKIYPSDANFVLVKVRDANNIYEYLIRNKIVVRNRSNVELCDGCLRVTIGTLRENDRLLRALSEYDGSSKTT